MGISQRLKRSDQFEGSTVCISQTFKRLLGSIIVLVQCLNAWIDLNFNQVSMAQNKRYSWNFLLQLIMKKNLLTVLTVLFLTF
ncbi:hypothetical protein MJO29_011024 [Puccinia striiformis f. sp. tritici]|nr:hypothetical protein MJO29_011024 [Puccinia striiformis f. sp. tritici]